MCECTQVNLIAAFKCPTAQQMAVGFEAVVMG